MVSKKNIERTVSSLPDLFWSTLCLLCTLRSTSEYSTEADPSSDHWRHQAIFEVRRLAAKARTSHDQASPKSGRVTHGPVLNYFRYE